MRLTHRQTHLFGHVRTGHNIHRIGNIAWLRAEQQNVSRLVFDALVYSLVACAVNAMMREFGMDRTRFSKFGCNTTCAMSW